MANVIVDILTTYELISGISAALLGLTVLSWGNSVGDAFATIAISRRGFGEMAVTGSIAGPVFNLMFGLGLTCVRVNFVMQDGIPFTLKELNATERLTILTLMATASVVLVLVFLAISNNFELTKTHGYVLSIKYCLIVALIVAFSIDWEKLIH